MNAIPLKYVSWIAGSEASCLMVLVGCFDDSGTHDDAEIVAMAGFIGPLTTWESFSPEWAKILAREEIDFFHLAECEEPAGPFERWPIGRRDSVIHDLRQTILGQELWGVGGAVNRADWDRLVTGFHRYWLGSPYEWCFGVCMNWLMRLGREKYPGMPISAVFDKRPNDSKRMEYVASLYPRVPEAQPELQAISFADMKSFFPLQAADMIATETYRYMRDGRVARPHFQNMLDSGRLHGTFYDEPEIITLLSDIEKEPGFQQYRDEALRGQSS